MKHRVVVQAIVKLKGRVLLIRRSHGRPSLIGKYELPGGSLDNGEQPDDSIRRHLASDTGVNYEAPLYIEDVLSMKDREDVDTQYIIVVYSLLDNNSLDIKLSTTYDKYLLSDPEKVDPSDLRDSAQLALGLYDGTIDLNKTSTYSGKDVEKTTKNKTITIYSDGGSRGNPGPSAGAFVIFDVNNNPISKGSEYIGITTNNQAEYHGLLLGLEKAIELGIQKVEFRIDSMLVVNQLKGLYSIKNRELWPVNDRIKLLLEKISEFKFTHIPRELNKVADSLVNKILDEHKEDQ